MYFGGNCVNLLSGTLDKKWRKKKNGNKTTTVNERR
jgi:hypothetical protein